MNITSEFLTSTAIFGFAIVMLGYFIRRWMERIEAKVDAIMELKGRLIPREEFDRGMSRIHTRLDDHIGEEQKLIDRVAHLEGQARK